MVFPSNDDLLFSADNFTHCQSFKVNEFIDATSNFVHNSLSFLHLNINSCHSNFDELAIFLSSLRIKFTVIALTETNLTENIDRSFELEGYKSIGWYSKHGIKIFYLDFVHVSVESQHNYNDNVLETFFIKIKSLLIGDLLFGAVYRPHSATVSQFQDSFEQNIIYKLRRNERVVICGDFNINLYNIDNQNLPQDTLNFMNLMNENNFVSAIDKITPLNKVNPLNSSLIDHFWCRLPFSYSSQVIETNMSDHFTISLVTTINQSTDKVTIKFRDFSLNNGDFLQTDLPNLINNSLNLNLNNPNQCTPTFINWLSRIFNLYFPIKTKQLGIKRLKSPWMTDSLLACIKKKHRFFTLYR